MNSPVEELLQRFVKVDKKGSTAVYIQLAQQIINSIQRGILPPGSALPGTRSMSRLLHLHRNTVVSAYDELASQGWIEIIPNKGSFVMRNKSQNLKSTVTISNNTVPLQTGFDFHQAHHLEPVFETIEAPIVFSDGQPDLRMLSVSNLSRWYTASMKRTKIKEALGSHQKTSVAYEKQLCNFLNLSRGFHTAPENLLTTRSPEMSLYLISQLLFRPGDIVLVGTPSYFLANMIFHQAGAKIVTIPIDAQGLNVNFIRKKFKKGSIRCVYCTPQRHYPTTVTLSLERRFDLMNLANEYGFAIIEDDFDYDFQYESFPMAPMSIADNNGMVIYMGRFGQSLLPSFQTGFVIATQNLIQAAKNYRQMIDHHGDFVMEQVLAQMIHEGEIHRLLKKSIQRYKKRCELFCEAIDTQFGNRIEWKKPNGGLAVWIQFKPTISLTKLAAQARKIGLELPNYLLYQDRNICGIRLGFGQFNEEEIPEVVAKLRQAYDLCF